MRDGETLRVSSKRLMDGYFHSYHSGCCVQNWLVKGGRESDLGDYCIDLGWRWWLNQVLAMNVVWSVGFREYFTCMVHRFGLSHEKKKEDKDDSKFLIWAFRRVLVIINCDEYNCEEEIFESWREIPIWFWAMLSLSYPVRPSNAYVQWAVLIFHPEILGEVRTEDRHLGRVGAYMELKP